MAFEKAIALHAAKYALGNVPRPPGWSGWRIAPLTFEFGTIAHFAFTIASIPSRIHDAAWEKMRLYP